MATKKKKIKRKPGRAAGFTRPLQSIHGLKCPDCDMFYEWKDLSAISAAKGWAWVCPVDRTVLRIDEESFQPKENPSKGGR